MKKGTKKSSIQHVPKTKEQLQREIEVARKRKIVVEQFYPKLVEATVSIDEAKMLIQAISSLMMEEVMQTMKVKKFSEIMGRLVEKLTPNNERQLLIENLLGVFKNENLFVARELIEGMNNAISQMVMEEQRTRKLDTLKADWDKMLN